MKRRSNLTFLFSLLLSVSVSCFAVADPASGETEHARGEAAGPGAGDAPDRQLLIGRAHVVPGEVAAPGYARYTYLLLTQASDEINTNLNRELLDAYLVLERARVYEEGNAPRDIINLITIPLRETPASPYPDIEWLLAHYDFLRASAIRRVAGNLDAAVPYAIASTVPLGDGSVVEIGRVSVVDLSKGAWSLIEFVGGDEEMTAGEDGPMRGDARLTGRAFLLSGDREEAGYGLYSYLLFAERPNPATLSLHAAVLDAYLNVSDVSRFEEAGVDREELNVFYLPVRERAPNEPAVDWLLGQYDFARAQIVLRIIEGGDRGGPYIISYAEPLTLTTGIDRKRLLVQDLSGVPADLAFLWVKEFISQARQPQYWNTRELRRFMVSLRTSISVVATAFVEVRSAHADVSTFLEDKIKLPQ